MQASLSIEKSRVAQDHARSLQEAMRPHPTAGNRPRARRPPSFVLLDYRFAPHANGRPRAEQTLVSMIDDVAQTLVR